MIICNAKNRSLLWILNRSALFRERSAILHISSHHPVVSKNVQKVRRLSHPKCVLQKSSTGFWTVSETHLPLYKLVQDLAFSQSFGVGV